MPFLNVEISLILGTSAPRAAFDTSSGLGYGTTTDSTNGAALYGFEAFAPPWPSGPPFNMQTPYYLDLSIGFDRPGLSPGASASFFADTDIYTPEPETAILTAIAILLLAVFAPKLPLGERGPARHRNL
ncbi:MAG TPA: hypothetical protein VJ728_12385 [Candidatus Binataceae bacterium]|nr:hypothetical protein [Candidatus Binataceae bacterium]